MSTDEGRRVQSRAAACDIAEDGRLSVYDSWRKVEAEGKKYYVGVVLRRVRRIPRRAAPLFVCEHEHPTTGEAARCSFKKCKANDHKWRWW